MRVRMLHTELVGATETVLVETISQSAVFAHAMDTALHTITIFTCHSLQKGIAKLEYGASPAQDRNCEELQAQFMVNLVTVIVFSFQLRPSYLTAFLVDDHRSE